MSQNSGLGRIKDLVKVYPDELNKDLPQKGKPLETKSLEEHQLINRVVYNTLPVTIEYKLTSHSKTLDKVILELRNNGCYIERKSWADRLNEHLKTL